jgi:hypothetical protein
MRRAAHPSFITPLIPEHTMFKLSNITANVTTATLHAGLIAAITAATLGLADSSHAAVSNGDFSAGLAGWSTAGNVGVDAASAYGPPPAGFSSQAIMGTAETTSFLFGGSMAGAAALESFAGLPAGALSGIGGLVGSGLSQKVTTAAGEAIAFSWKFMSNEPQNSPANDRAFLVLDGVLTTLTTVQTATFVGSSLSPMLDETAYASFSTGPLGAGSHTLVFGVIDIPDSLGASALAVTGVAVAAVPEPGSWALMLGGVAALGSLVRRRL